MRNVLLSNSIMNHSTMRVSKEFIMLSKFVDKCMHDFHSSQFSYSVFLIRKNTHGSLVDLYVVSEFCLSLWQVKLMLNSF